MAKAPAPNTKTPEEKIREIAYKLWVEAGQPEGTAQHHWFQAIEIANNNAKAVRKVSAKSATKKPVAKKATAKSAAKKAA